MAQRKKIYFPIWARRADIAIIRKAQPYHAGKSAERRHIYAVLANYSNLDKHRTIQPVPSTPASANVRVLAQRDCEFVRLQPRARRIPIEVGAELGKFYVRKTGPSPDLDVETYFTVEAMIHKTLRLSEWIKATADYTQVLLGSFQKPPQDLPDRLGVETPPEA